MKAIFRGKLYLALGDEGDDIILGAADQQFRVPLNDPTLIIDPTDDEVEEAGSLLSEVLPITGPLSERRKNPHQIEQRDPK